MVERCRPDPSTKALAPRTTRMATMATCTSTPRVAPGRRFITSGPGLGSGSFRLVLGSHHIFPPRPAPPRSRLPLPELRPLRRRDGRAVPNLSVSEVAARARLGAVRLRALPGRRATGGRVAFASGALVASPLPRHGAWRPPDGPGAREGPCARPGG